MKLIEIRNRPLRVLASVVVLLGMIVLGLGMIYGVGVASASLSGLHNLQYLALDVFDYFMLGVLTLAILGAVGSLAWACSYFYRKISNRFVCYLLALLTAGGILTVLYGIGMISPLMSKPAFIVDAIVIGFTHVLIVVAAGAVGYGIYRGVMALYNGPFDP